MARVCPQPPIHDPNCANQYRSTGATTRPSPAARSGSREDSVGARRRRRTCRSISLHGARRRAGSLDTVPFVAKKDRPAARKTHEHG
jgi:hypothetical protein